MRKLQWFKEKDTQNSGSRISRSKTYMALISNLVCTLSAKVQNKVYRLKIG